MQYPTTSEYIRGALYGLAAVCIWASFIVVSRLGVRTSLTPWDIAAIRFGVAGPLLLPYLISKGLALERLGWIGLAAIVVGCGSSSDEVAPPPATESEPSASASGRELAPPLAGVTLGGAAIALADFGGRPVLINVWSSW